MDKGTLKAKFYSLGTECCAEFEDIPLRKLYAAGIKVLLKLKWYVVSAAEGG